MRARVYTSAERCAMHPFAADLINMRHRGIMIKRIKVWPSYDLGLYPGIKAAFFGIPVVCEVNQ
jgi:hypothetical protein